MDCLFLVVQRIADSASSLAVERLDIVVACLPIHTQPFAHPGDLPNVTHYW